METVEALALVGGYVDKERIQNKLGIGSDGLGWIYLIRDSKTTGIVELF